MNGIEKKYGKGKVSTKEAELTGFNPTNENLEVLRNILLKARSDNQGGFSSYGKESGWMFSSSGLPQATPDQWDSLFDLAGIIPDEIKPLGNCFDCKHNDDGYERGYDAPCVSCRRPFMSYFEQK